MKLVVLAGAKEGAEIPLKKDKFVIGRAKDCTLRAGSEAISRHHCAVMKGDQGVSVRDLGSRNGTYVNEEKITGETALKDGDNLRVGTLEFRFDAAQAKSTKSAKPAGAAPAVAAAVGQDIDRSKKPKVKNVADAVSRAGSADHESEEIEDDISRWLIGPDPSDSAAGRETQSFRIDETQTLAKPPEDTAEAKAEEIAEEIEGEAVEAAKDGKKPKKLFGKLPPVPKNKATDSREAAENILREMTRRR